jgi:hypothetical protein
MYGSGTVENSGTISGGIQFYSNGSTLILDSGFVVNGNVSTYASNDTLELGGGPVSVSGIGTQYTNFKTIAFTNTDAMAAGTTGGLANNGTGPDRRFKQHQNAQYPRHRRRRRLLRQ